MLNKHKVIKRLYPEYIFKKEAAEILNVTMNTFNKIIKQNEVGQICELTIFDRKIYKKSMILKLKELYEDVYSDSEEFKPVKNTNNTFYINKNGDLYSTYYRRFLTPVQGNNMQFYHSIKVDSKISTKPVARLVAEHFLNYNPELKLEVSHIDGDLFNNHLSNLKFTNHKQNHQNKKAKEKLYEKQPESLTDDFKKLKDFEYYVKRNGGVYTLRSNGLLYPLAVYKKINGHCVVNLVKNRKVYSRSLNKLQREYFPKN